LGFGFPACPVYRQAGGRQGFDIEYLLAGRPASLELQPGEQAGIWDLTILHLSVFGYNLSI